MDNYELWLFELDEREYEADNAAWEFALLCATTGDLACPFCGYPVDVLDEAIVCPVCDLVWKDADALAVDAEQVERDRPVGFCDVFSEGRGV